MSVSFIERAKLNPAQKEAVQTTEGALLILAGAGSGKTRVLTHRVVHLIKDKDVKPWNILAITFTNKAANEMKERIEQMCGSDAEGIWVATFHSACVRILRREIEALGYTSSFTIYDDTDTASVLNKLCKEYELDTKMYPVKLLKAAISSLKNKRIKPASYQPKSFSALDQKLGELYADYEKELRKNNALDFDDLILKTIDLFEQAPEVLAKYQHRFRYIMVDEYQDTNNAQYILVKMLGDYWKNVCVVGDDDQSIYGWRGADINIILNFEKDYAQARVIKLEQNYRSTENILNAANTVIRNNAKRKQKNLWSENGEGEKIHLESFTDDKAEAAYVCGQIARMAAEGSPYSDFAVLYRTNATSRIFEEALVSRGVPFRIYGGQRFYDRKEVKDALAYLRLAVNPQDEVCLKRIINVPKRGIGTTTVDELELIASENEESMMAVVLDPADYHVKPKTAAKLAEFSALIQDLIVQSELCSISDMVQYTLDKTGLVEQYKKENTEEAAARIENLEEIVTAAAQFSMENPDAHLADFLEQVALVSDTEEEARGGSGAVSMMTVHSAKGLEFETVFLVAMEDGLFPLGRASENDDELEEERRLAYVGITRAKKRLYMTNAGRRMLHGSVRDMLRSRFLLELPKECTQTTESKPKLGGAGYYADRAKWDNRPVYRPAVQSARPAAGGEVQYSVGMRVKHKTFGKGCIVGMKNSGRDTVLQIAFEEKGIKELSAVFAPLEKL